MVNLHLCVWQQMYIYAVYLTRTESRGGKVRTCGAVQFSGCSRSLCRAAGCAYLLLRSVKHKELKMSWKGSKSLFSIPMPPTSLNTSQSSPPFVLLSAHLGSASPRPCLPWVLAPSMWLARLSSCRGSAVVSVGLKGCLSKEERKAWAWPRYDDLTSLEESSCRAQSATIIFTISGRVSSYCVFHSVLCERRLVNRHHPEQAALFVIRAQHTCA